MQKSFIRYYHLRISVEDLIKSFTFTVREIFQNVDFLWSVFSRVCAESDTTGYDTIIRYDSVHVQENKDQRKPAFWDTSRNVKYSHPRVFFSISFSSQSTPLSIFAFLYEEKMRKIVKAIYVFIIHIKKQKCCGNGIAWSSAIIHEEKTRFKWTF